MNTNPLEKMAEFITTLKVEEIPLSIRERIRDQIFSVLSATLAFRSLPYSRKWDLRNKNRPLPLSPLLSLIDKAVSFSTALDYDDYLFMGHTGHTAIWVPLLLGKEWNLPEEEIFTGMVIANELMGRMGIPLLFGPLNGQMWSPIHRLGTTAVVSRFLQLSPDETLHALALSLSAPPMPSYISFMGTDAKTRISAEGVMGGILSPFLSQGGLKGAREELTSPLGFYYHFTYAPIHGAFDGLKKSWVFHTLSIKPIPACAYLINPLLILRNLDREMEEKTGFPFKPTTIRKIQVFTHALGAGMDTLSSYALKRKTIHPLLIPFSTPLSFGIYLLLGEYSRKVFDEKTLRTYEDLIWEGAKKVEIVHDLSLTISMIRTYDAFLPLKEWLKVLSSRQWYWIYQRGSHFLQTLREGTSFQIKRRWAFKEVFPLLKGIFPVVGKALFKPLLGFYSPPLPVGDLDFSHFRFSFPTRVKVFLKDGTVKEGEMIEHPGSANTPHREKIAKKKWEENGSLFFPEESIKEFSEKISKNCLEGRIPIDLLKPIIEVLNTPYEKNG